MEDGGRVERSRVELAKKRLILSQIYSTLLYFPSLPLNLNGPLGRDEELFELPSSIFYCEALVVLKLDGILVINPQGATPDKYVLYILLF